MTGGRRATAGRKRSQVGTLPCAAPTFLDPTPEGMGTDHLAYVSRLRPRTGDGTTRNVTRRLDRTSRRRLCLQRSVRGQARSGTRSYMEPALPQATYCQLAGGNSQHAWSGGRTCVRWAAVGIETGCSGWVMRLRRGQHSSDADR